MGAIASRNRHVVFKGAMVLNTLMTNVPNVTTARRTEDIDADWGAQNFSDAQLLHELQLSLSLLRDSDLYIIKTRDSSTKRSAGFAVRSHSSDETLFTLDISMKTNNYSTTYNLAYNAGTVAFTGSHPCKIYVDKLTALSTRVVYRRVKDIYDLYLLSTMSTVFKTDELSSILASTGVELGDFHDFSNNAKKEKGIEYAYDKMVGISNKPTFDEMYARVKTFITPFIHSSNPPKAVWLSNIHTGNYGWILV